MSRSNTPAKTKITFLLQGVRRLLRIQNIKANEVPNYFNKIKVLVLSLKGCQPARLDQPLEKM